MDIYGKYAFSHIYVNILNGNFIFFVSSLLADPSADSVLADIVKRGSLSDNMAATGGSKPVIAVIARTDVMAVKAQLTEGNVERIIVGQAVRFTAFRSAGQTSILGGPAGIVVVPFLMTAGGRQVAVALVSVMIANL